MNDICLVYVSVFHPGYIQAGLSTRFSQRDRRKLRHLRKESWISSWVSSTALNSSRSLSNTGLGETLSVCIIFMLYHAFFCFVTQCPVFCNFRCVCFRRLVERLENMRRSAVGNGLSQCLLCGEVFGLLRSPSVLCLDCCMVQTGLNLLNIMFSTLDTHTHCFLQVRLVISM